ncbi:MAG: carbonic anhydrase [Firmicutes bacterium]|jgi:carbonic anhydrase|nr:carbonic anhydrase [Bacillota bacterium]
MGRKTIEDILSFNKDFVEGEKYKDFSTSKKPAKKTVILSCMDTRLTELLPQAMNLKNGDIKLIKNAGATIMHPFGSVMRSIVVAVYEFKADNIIVIGHHGCGMSNLDGEGIISKMVDRNVNGETIDILENSGINIRKWLKGFDSEIEAIKESVSSIKNHPLIPEDVNVHGMIMDPETGKLDVVVDGFK